MKIGNFRADQGMASVSEMLELVEECDAAYPDFRLRTEKDQEMLLRRALKARRNRERKIVARAAGVIFDKTLHHKANPEAYLIAEKVVAAQAYNHFVDGGTWRSHDGLLPAETERINNEMQQLVKDVGKKEQRRQRRRR